ncbi:MAG: YheC/YheD family protein [Bacillota bacterium]
MRRKLRKRLERTKMALSGRGSSRISDKWAKTKVLRTNRKLRKYIPLTKKLTKASLRTMLLKFGMVYIKPVRGSLGNGVMKVERIMGKAGRTKCFEYQLDEKRSDFSTYESAYRSILKDTKGKPYLVQKGIHLLKHIGRPFDTRLVVQQAPKGGWEATGTISRVAHPRKIVTNGSQGGTIYPTAFVLGSYANAGKRTALMKKMDRIGIAIAKRLRRTYPGIVEIGVDFALDSKLKPWILEVNTHPDHCPFALLSDQSMIRKIIQYGKAYGRTYRMNCLKAKQGLLPSPHMRIGKK